MIITRKDFINERIQQKQGAFFLISDTDSVISCIASNLKDYEMAIVANQKSKELIFYISGPIRPSGANKIKNELERTIGLLLKKTMCIFIGKNSTTEAVENKFKKISATHWLQIGRG